MARDPIESLAVIPSSADNFDELWMVVNRLNGRFVERMVRRLKETDCGSTRTILDDQIFMDSAVSYQDGKVATAITSTNGVIYTVTLPSHGYSNGDTVHLTNVFGFETLSNTSWIIGGVTTNTFVLVTRV